MNIAFFLTPKSEVVWVSAHGTIEQALERMKPRGFAAVPMLDYDGRYVGTLSTGDLMWHLLGAGGDWQETAHSTPVAAVQRRFKDSAVHIDAKLEALIARAMDQSFVPVVDDREVFIGIIRRQPIIAYCAQLADLSSKDGGRQPREIRALRRVASR